MKSLYSIANGGFGGTGLGKGTFLTADPRPKPLIPYVNSDFIYSALAQELGLIGAAALLLVFMLFVARGMKIALQADDGFSKLLAAGLTFGFALQTFIIVGGVLRLIPLTGITLPFVSYGGSSVVANFLLLAGLLLVSNRANSTMNKQISRLAIVALVLLAALVLATTYWQSWAVGGLAARAGQRDRARRAVPHPARADLRLRRQDAARREPRREAYGGRRSSSAATRRTGSRRRSSATRRRAVRAPGSSAARTRISPPRTRTSARSSRSSPTT